MEIFPNWEPPNEIPTSHPKGTRLIPKIGYNLVKPVKPPLPLSFMDSKMGPKMPQCNHGRPSNDQEIGSKPLCLQSAKEKVNKNGRPRALPVYPSIPRI